MGIRIPTGVKVVRSTSTAKGLVAYQCDKCGTISSFPLEVSGWSEAQFHALASAKKKNRVQEQAREASHKRVEAMIAETANRINEKHNYTDIKKEIQCSNCGFSQPWSQWPLKWRETKIGKVWFWLCVIVYVPFMWLFSISCMLDRKNAPLTKAAGVIDLALFLGFYVALPVVYSFIIRKKKIAAIEKTIKNRPVFFYWGNREELMNSPFGEALFQTDM